jgi:hypothetical protein
VVAGLRLGGCLAKAEHVGEAKLADSIAIGYLALSLAQFAASVKL